MFEYVLRIEGLVDRFPNTMIWRLYDKECHRAKPQRPSLEWHQIDQAVLDSAMEEHRAWAKNNRQENHNQGQNQGQNSSKREFPIMGPAIIGTGMVVPEATVGGSMSVQIVCRLATNTMIVESKKIVKND